MEKISGCCCKSETFLVLGLFGAFERKAMVEGSKRTKKMKFLRFLFCKEIRNIRSCKNSKEENSWLFIVSREECFPSKPFNAAELVGHVANNEAIIVQVMETFAIIS